jgi:ferrous-iron efflux pump FieF
MTERGETDRIAALARSERLAQGAALLSTSVAALLILIKAYGWWETGSVALLSSLVDSVLDASMSLVILLAVRHAAKPADREHRYGHGKVEAVAALVQAALIVLSAILILIECAQRFVAPEPVRQELLGLTLVGIGLVMNLALIGAQTWVIRRTQSVAIEADRAHYTGDVLIAFGVIASLLLAGLYNISWADPLIAAVISLAMMKSAIGVGRKALDLLMDRELPDADRARVRDMASAHPGVRGVRDLRTRSAGTDTFVQMILLVDGALTVREAHKIVDDVERDICNAFPSAEVLIHEEPDDLPQDRSTSRRPGSRHDDVAE